MTAKPYLTKRTETKVSTGPTFRTMSVREAWETDTLLKNDIGRVFLVAGPVSTTGGTEFVGYFFYDSSSNSFSILNGEARFETAPAGTVVTITQKGASS